MNAGSIVEIREPARGFEPGTRGIVTSTDPITGLVTVAIRTDDPVPILVPFSPETLFLVEAGAGSPVDRA
jgi:hypothetical protein